LKKTELENFWYKILRQIRNVVGAVISSEDYVFSQADKIAAPKGIPRCIRLPFWV